MTVVFKRRYSDPEAVPELAKTLGACLPEEGEIIFICIGTDKNILDCMGPMVGSMIKEKAPELTVYGTLEDPIHALNITRALHGIRNRHPGALEVAIDASAGKADEVGVIQVRLGSLDPGKAVRKRLPAVGNLSVTGIVVADDGESGYLKTGLGSICPVYHIACAIANSVCMAKESLLARARAGCGSKEG